MSTLGRPGLLTIAAAAAMQLLVASSARAQSPGGACIFLCSPSLKFEPTLTIENPFGGHRVQNLATGEVAREERGGKFEIILALDVPTTIPRVGLGVEAIWAPFATTASNPFTGASAGDLGVSQIRDNQVELEFELNLQLLEPETTAGWVGAHFDIVDQFSPAKRPDAAAAYTHKLDFEFDVGVTPFKDLEQSWLRHIELETSFDYLATGLVRAGDVPEGEVRYLDKESPWSLSLVLVLPIAPLNPESDGTL